MKKRKKYLAWYYMLCKRLMKKYTFVLLLCAIPLLVFGMNSIAQKDSGMLKIILCTQDSQDELATEIFNSLREKTNVIDYEIITDPKEAITMVNTGNADAAWIVEEQLQEKINEYVVGTGNEVKLVHIVEREDTIALQLSREKLYGVMYQYISYALYENHVGSLLEHEISQENLQKHYDATHVEDGIFRFEFLDQGGSAEGVLTQNYLTAPLRGMLALVVLLCCLAAALYYLQDEEAGVLSFVAYQKRTIYFYIYEAAALSLVGLATLGALWLSGLWTTFIWEIITMVFYLLSCILFASILRRICRSIRGMGSLIPLIMVASLVLTPIFFALKGFTIIQHLLPSYYYLNSIHNGRYLIELVVFCIVSFGVDLILNKKLSFR